MPEPSSSLTSQFRKRLRPEDKSVAGMLSEDASKEDFEFLRMVATGVPYGAFMERISLTAFNRLRALAISDLFEDVEEEVKQQLVGPLDLLECRAMPEYLEIVEGLRKVAAELSDPETAEDWLREKGGPKARRYMQKVLSQTKDMMTGARAAAEIIDREIPRALPSEANRRNVQLDTEATELIRETLEINRKRLAEKTDADPET